MFGQLILVGANNMNDVHRKLSVLYARTAYVVCVRVCMLTPASGVRCSIKPSIDTASGTRPKTLSSCGERPHSGRSPSIDQINICAHSANHKYRSRRTGYSILQYSVGTVRSHNKQSNRIGSGNYDFIHHNMYGFRALCVCLLFRSCVGSN